MNLGSLNISEFVDQFLMIIWMLFYAIINPIVFLILLGILFIYIVYRVIKHLKSFYHISLRFKLPRALIDGVLGLLLILLLYDFYGQIVPIDYEYDDRSSAISYIIRNLINESVKMNGNDEIFGITTEEWNKLNCILPKDKGVNENCEYINGIATKKYYLDKDKKYSCPLYEKSPLKECTIVSARYYEELSIVNRLINHISYHINGQYIVYNKIPMEAFIEILEYPNVLQPLLKILSKPCNYINKFTTNKYSLEYVHETEKILKCNKIDKDEIKLYLYGKDQIGNRKIQSTLIIKRED